MKNSSTIPKDQHAVLEWSLARIAEVPGQRLKRQAF